MSFQGCGRTDFDAIADRLVQPLDRHLRSKVEADSQGMGRRTKSQRELNEMIDRLTYTNAPSSNVYQDPLTLDKILRRYQQEARSTIRTRAKSELPRWNIRQPSHSPDGKPPLLPRLTWLPVVNVLSRQKHSTRPIPYY
jgi:hypothetical protein